MYKVIDSLRESDMLVDDGGKKKGWFGLLAQHSTGRADYIHPQGLWKGVKKGISTSDGTEARDLGIVDGCFSRESARVSEAK